MSDLVKVERSTTDEAIAVITLDSPANRNALSQALLTELRQARPGR